MFALAILTTSALAAAPVLVAGCGGGHDEAFVEVNNDQCATCHLADYQSVPDPNHIEEGFPTTCVECHLDDFWRPALASNLHPRDIFPIDQDPHRVACLDCHDSTLGSSLEGQNTNCIGCHTGAHRRDKMDRKHDEVEDYAATDDGTGHFCLECHPDGRNEDN